MKFFGAEFIDREQLCVSHLFLEYFHSAEAWSSHDHTDRIYIGTFAKRLPWILLKHATNRARWKTRGRGTGSRGPGVWKTRGPILTQFVFQK